MDDQLAVVETPIVEEVIEIDLSPKEFKYRDKSSGDIYIVTEPTEDSWGKYQDIMGKGTKFDEEGRPTAMGDHSGSANASLMNGCIFKLVKLGTNQMKRQPVALVQLRAWPARVTQPIVQKMLEISALRKKDTLEEVDKQIAKLQEKRKKLLAQEVEKVSTGDAGEEEKPKN